MQDSYIPYWAKGTKAETTIRNGTCKVADCNNPRQPGSSRCYDHRKGAPTYAEGLEKI